MSIVDPLLNWLLIFNPFISILIISVILGLITTFVYKYASNQKKIKELKDQTKHLQKKIKEVAKTNPEKMMELNSKMMKLNGPLMKETMKPTLWTIIPSLLILTWMATNLAFMPILPGQTFDVTAEFNEGIIGNVSMFAIPEGLEFVNGTTQEIIDEKAIWVLRSTEENTYTLTINYRDLDFNQDVAVTNTRKYINPEQIVKKEGLKKIIVSNEKIKPFKGAPIVGGLNWLWSYIILTMIFTTLLRKLLKVY